MLSVTVATKSSQQKGNNTLEIYNQCKTSKMATTTSANFTGNCVMGAWPEAGGSSWPPSGGFYHLQASGVLHVCASRMNLYNRLCASFTLSELLVMDPRLSGLLFSGSKL